MPTIAVEDTEKLRAFEHRMQLEGAAAFAAGPAPWEHWDDVGTLGTYQIWRNTVRHATPDKHHRKPLAIRLLTGLAQLAVLALLVGSAGVYFSIITPEPVASNSIQPAPIVLAGRTNPWMATGSLPVIRTQPDYTAHAPGSEPDAGFAQDSTPLTAAVVPLQLEPAPATGDAPGDAPASEPAAATDAVITSTLERLPETAAGQAATPQTTALTPQPESTSHAQHGPVAETLPQQISLRTTAVETLPDNPARSPAPAQDARVVADGWVVNLASYTFESMARRKLAAFRAKGVDAELVHVTVKGKPMVRLRTTGYRSFREAHDWVALLEERLELEGAWVAKYQPDEE